MATRKANENSIAEKNPEVGAGGEDPELLNPVEEAMLQSGNAGPVSGTEGVEIEAAGDRGAKPEQAPAAEEEQGRREAGAEREELSEEQVGRLKPTDMVPAWALQKERQESRELKRKLEDLGRRLGEQEERFNRASERLRQVQPRPESDPEPNVQTDPAAHQQWELRQHRQVLQMLARQQQSSAAQAQMVQEQAVLAGLEQQFAQEHPDYYQRVKFMRERRERELETMGYGNPNERAQMIINEAAMLIAGAARQGRNPAEVAYRLAEQWGYQGAAGESARQPGEPRSAVQQVRELQRKQAAAVSLQAIAARPASGPVTLEEIADMDDETYERYVERHGGDMGALLRRE